jgi:hypothetical protein
MNSEEGLTSYALCEPHRIYATDEQWEKDQIEALCLTFKETLKKELIASELLLERRAPVLGFIPLCRKLA